MVLFKVHNFKGSRRLIRYLCRYNEESFCIRMEFGKKIIISLERTSYNMFLA